VLKHNTHVDVKEATIIVQEITFFIKESVLEINIMTIIGVKLILYHLVIIKFMEVTRTVLLNLQLQLVPNLVTQKLILVNTPMIFGRYQIFIHYLLIKNLSNTKYLLEGQFKLLCTFMMIFMLTKLEFINLHLRPNCKDYKM